MPFLSRPADDIKLGIACLIAGSLSAAFVLHATPSEPFAMREWLAAIGEASDKSKAQAAELPRLATALAFETLADLDEANRTGDYRRFRETAAPAFRERNDSNALARIFRGFRRAGMPFSPPAGRPLTWTRAPHLTENGQLAFAVAQPRPGGRLIVGLSYEREAAGWRLFTITARFAANTRVSGLER